MTGMNGCQIPCLPRIAEGKVSIGFRPVGRKFKSMFAKIWNRHVKKLLKRFSRIFETKRAKSAGAAAPAVAGVKIQAGDLVRVRTDEEIRVTLDRWNEVKGCAFLDCMWQYCGTVQRVLRPVERFFDERDYQVKKCRGLVILDGILCRGTPVFGPCDRCCHLFWRTEWLTKIDEDSPFIQ